jgi:hypothetical protein
MARILMLAAVLLLSACAATGDRPGRGAAPTDPAAYLPSRAEARWRHVIEGRWQEAYGYLTPGTRQVLPLDAYRAGLEASNLVWTGAESLDVTCSSEDSCVVAVRVSFDLRGGLPGVPKVSAANAVRETWLRTGGEWYFLPDKAGG